MNQDNQGEISLDDLNAVRDFLAGERDELPTMGRNRSAGRHPQNNPVVSHGISRARRRSADSMIVQHA